MGNLKFYDVDNKYITYIKNFDNQVPDMIYDKNNKFFCGMVLTINGYSYYAPVSSHNKKQRTNFLIMDNNIPISSIRFCFMFPAPEDVLTLTDFSQKPQTYIDLVNAEIKFCNRNSDAIYRKAMDIYEIGSNRNHPLSYCCCNFKLLEQKCKEYMAQKEVEQTKEQVAPTITETSNKAI